MNNLNFLSRREEQTHSQAVRDRVLTYLHQMNLNPVESLQLALATLEKTGTDDMGETVETLLALLREGGRNSEESPDLDNAALVRPPMNRQCMISEEMNISILGSLARMITGGFRPVKSERGEK
ncbi:hypothetical protein C4J81_15030 [Deltaproteobacteria bacterium Smac51]|nr:hypothetical protein C4J81_15030 [Deltaproteobacteria bacterium Smac51]